MFGVDWRREIREKKVTVVKRSQQVRDNEGKKQAGTDTVAKSEEMIWPRSPNSDIQKLIM